MCKYCNPVAPQLFSKEERESEIECDLAIAQRKKREDDALREQGKPTLKVTFADLLRKKS